MCAGETNAKRSGKGGVSDKQKRKRGGEAVLMHIYELKCDVDMGSRRALRC